ncbi:hypothetical protein B0H11DRAFT_2061786, partial [Mycena galericulata]
MVDRMIETAAQWQLALDTSRTDGLSYLFEVDDPIWSRVFVFGPKGSCFGAFIHRNCSKLVLTMSNQDGTQCRSVDVREMLEKAAKDLPILQRRCIQQGTREASLQYLDFLLRLEAFLYFLLWHDFPSFIHANLMKDLHDHHRATFRLPEGCAQASFEGLCAKSLWDLRRKHQPFHPVGKPLTGALVTLLPPNWGDPRVDNRLGVPTKTPSGSRFLRLSDPSRNDHPVAPEAASIQQPSSIVPNELEGEGRKRHHEEEDKEEEVLHSPDSQEGAATGLRFPRPHPPEPSSSDITGITGIAIPDADLVAIPKTPQRQRSTTLRALGPAHGVRRSEREKESHRPAQPIRRPSRALPRPKVFAQNVHSAAGAPLILGHSLVMTFEQFKNARLFGSATLEGDADALLEFFKTHGGRAQLAYVRHLCAVLNFSEQRLHGIPSAQAGAQEWQSTSLGLVFERVDDDPRTFSEETLRGDGEAVVAFLNGRPTEDSRQYVGYLRAVLESVEKMLE